MSVPRAILFILCGGEGHNKSSQVNQSQLNAQQVQFTVAQLYKKV